MRISKGTVMRTILLGVALANQALAAFGKSPLPFEDEAVTEFVSLLCTAGAAVAAWWKNNSFTLAAIRADSFLHKFKKDA